MRPQSSSEPPARPGGNGLPSGVPSGGGDGGGNGPDDDGTSSSSSAASRGYKKKSKVFMMKPEIKYFREYSKIEDFTEWWDYTSATLSACGYHNHIDWECYPKPDDEENFVAMDRWLYLILKHKIKTVSGRKIIRDHRGTKSGRNVLFRIIQHAHTSGATQLNSQIRLTDITDRKSVV